MDVKKILIVILFSASFAVACGDGRQEGDEAVSNPSGIGSFLGDVIGGVADAVGDIANGVGAVVDRLHNEVVKEVFDQIPDWVIPTLGKINRILYGERGQAPYRLVISSKLADRALGAANFNVHLNGAVVTSKIAAPVLVDKSTYKDIRLEFKQWFNAKIWDGRGASVSVQIRSLAHNLCLESTERNFVWRPCLSVLPGQGGENWHSQFFFFEKKSVADKKSLYKLYTNHIALKTPGAPMKCVTAVSANPLQIQMKDCNDSHYEWSSISNRDFK